MGCTSMKRVNNEKNQRIAYGIIEQVSPFFFLIKARSTGHKGLLKDKHVQ